MFFLQLRNELRKLFGKKRTYIGFGVFLVAQNLMPATVIWWPITFQRSRLRC